MNKAENKVLIMSDNHGDIAAMNRIIQREWPFDVLVHCGDFQCNLDLVLEHRAEFRLLAVQGNCDLRSEFPEEKISDIGDFRVMIVHGHHHYVDFDTDVLAGAAARNHADIVCYGHTHVPEIKEQNGILVLNPGSLTRSRRYDRKGSYMILHTAPAHKKSVDLMSVDGEPLQY
ncbi:MAG: metallophosphoesterase [Eubacterium sp.]|nr:metallophosphoesterase [Eubacterium sp.]